MAHLGAGPEVPSSLFTPRETPRPQRSGSVVSTTSSSSPPARPPSPAASFTRYGLLIVCLLSGVAYYELAAWNGSSSGLLPGGASGGGGAGDALFSNAFRVKTSVGGGSDSGTGKPSGGGGAKAPAPPPGPPRRIHLTSVSATPPPRSHAEAVPVIHERGPEVVYGLDNDADDRVCATPDVCMRADEWDALQRTVDCWGRPGSWELDDEAAVLHGRRWHRTDGRSPADLPAGLRYAWTPAEAPGVCDPAEHPLLPFYRSDFCSLLKRRRILLVGDTMNHQFREAIADAAAPGGGPAWRPKPSRTPRPSKRPPPPGESAEPDPSLVPPAEEGEGEPSEEYAEGAGNATGGAAPEEVVEESEEEEEGGEAAAAGGDEPSEEDDDAAKRAKAAEALLGADKDSIGRDGVTSDVEVEDGGDGEEGGGGARRALAADAAGDDGQDGWEELEVDAAVLLGDDEEGDAEVEEEEGRAGAPSAPPPGDAPGDSDGGLQRLAALHAEVATSRRAVEAAQRRARRLLAASGAAAVPPPPNASSPMPPARALRPIFRGAVSRICDYALSTTVEYKRNDRLYPDGDRIPRARSQGFFEFPWMARVPESDIIILARPTTPQPDKVHFGTLRRALQRVRAANPRALVIVRNVAPPHVGCLQAGTPLTKRQPPALLAPTGRDRIYGQNEALRMFLRSEFPGVLHMDVAGPTALRPDMHSSGECVGYQSPGPVDHWVRLLFNVLRALERARKRGGGKRGGE